MCEKYWSNFKTEILSLESNKTISKTNKTGKNSKSFNHDSNVETKAECIDEQQKCGSLVIIANDDDDNYDNLFDEEILNENKDRLSEEGSEEEEDDGEVSLESDHSKEEDREIDDSKRLKQFDQDSDLNCLASKIGKIASQNCPNNNKRLSSGSPQEALQHNQMASGNKNTLSKLVGNMYSSARRVGVFGKRIVPQDVCKNDIFILFYLIKNFFLTFFSPHQHLVEIFE